jgi:hypothetical protein
MAPSSRQLRSNQSERIFTMEVGAGAVNKIIPRRSHNHSAASHHGCAIADILNRITSTLNLIGVELQNVSVLILSLLSSRQLRSHRA